MTKFDKYIAMCINSTEKGREVSRNYHQYKLETNPAFKAKLDRQVNIYKLNKGILPRSHNKSYKQLQEEYLQKIQNDS